MMLWSATAKGQDFPYHYFSHSVPGIVNPSLAAATTEMSIETGVYTLWAGGFKPANDYLLSLTASPDFFKRGNYQRNNTRIGLGMNMLNDRIGPFNHSILQLIYAYHIPLSRDVQLSLGVSGFIEHMSIDISSLTPNQPDDPRLMTESNRSFLFDGGFGASILGENFMLGLSVLNMAPGNFKLTENPAASMSAYRKIFLSGSYSYKPNRNFGLKPHVVLRNSNVKWVNFDTFLQFDLNYFNAGAGYRSEKSLFFFLKVPFQDFTFSYTSENPFAANHMMGNGHTITIGWKVQK